MAADAYVLGLGADGTYVWDRIFSSMGVTRARRMTLGADESLIVAGSYADGADFGGGARAAGDVGAFLVALSPDGSYLWDETFDPAGGFMGFNDVTAAADGRLWAVGFVAGDYDFGNGARTSADADVVVLALEADGTLRWATVFESPGDDFGVGLSIGDGMVFVSGIFIQEIDFGFGANPAAGMDDGFVVALRDEMAL
jgi:hypothetical protein